MRPFLKHSRSLALMATVIPSAYADAPADALLAKVAAASLHSHTLRADLKLSRGPAGTPPITATGTILLMRPNLALIRMKGNDEKVPLTLASDGTSLFSFPTPETYSKVAIDPQATQINEPWWALPLRYFFTQSYAVFPGVKDADITTHMLPDQTLHGQLFHIVAVDGTQPFPYVEKIYITENDLLERTVVQFGALGFSAELTNVKLDEPLTRNAFRFLPPKTATLKQDDPTATMLAIGSSAPPFSLPSVTGDRTSLTQARRGMKATLVNFWYLNCPPCRLENSVFEKLYEQFHARGLNIVAIDKGDSASDVAKYVKRTGLQFIELLGGDDIKGSVFANYKTVAYPVTYLLDAEGHIVYRAAGQDEAGLKQALFKLGLQ
jgi:peroxiredoxin/outer membrane lipoprotein-sorting protein